MTWTVIHIQFLISKKKESVLNAKKLSRKTKTQRWPRLSGTVKISNSITRNIDLAFKRLHSSSPMKQNSVTWFSNLTLAAIEPNRWEDKENATKQLGYSIGLAIEIRFFVVVFFRFFSTVFFFTIISFSFFFFNFRCDHRWTLHWLPWSESHSPTLSVFSVIKLSTTVSHRSARTPKMSRIKKNRWNSVKFLALFYFFFSRGAEGGMVLFLFFGLVFSMSHFSNLSNEKKSETRFSGSLKNKKKTKTR